MSVKIRPYRRAGWEVDIRVTLPDGTEHRLRRKAPFAAKSAALRWAEERERKWSDQLTQPGPKAEPKKEVPTLQAFAPRFLDGHARANQQKPSGIAAKDSILQVYLVPLLGTSRLDTITTEDVQRLKSHLADRAAKTVNNVLVVLNVLLKQAVAWQVITQMPCAIRLLKTSL
jgi:hypothetical protein